MPRTLPWAVAPPARKSSTPVSSASVKRKPGDALREPRGRRSSKRPSRTPSTSPPREPPSEQYMIEGLENDDQYIMVEDEFLSTAQAFTSHLHHAEYLRRKKQAKIENATKVTDLTQSRPTDGRTPMSSELRSNIRAEKASNRRNEALDRMREDAGRPLVDSELEDEGSDEDREDDPWMGTTLQPLMAASRQPRSLVGLQGIKSTTRAAMGYSNASQVGLQTQAAREGGGDERREVVNSRTTHNNTTTEANGHVVVDDTASTDDDDLDALSLPRKNPPPPQRRPSMPNPSTSSGRSAATPPQPTPKRPVKTSPDDGKRVNLNTIPMHRHSSSSTSRHRSGSRQPFKSRFSTFFDDWDEPSLSTPPPPPPKVKQEEREERVPSRTSTSVGSKRIRREGSDDKSRKQRLSEVPTFL